MKGIAKIISTPTGPFLLPWSFEETAQESYALLSKRPFVYLRDPHDALEKAMWFYLHDIIPVIGERAPGVAILEAERLSIDSLVVDVPSLEALREYLFRRREPLASISVLGTSFPLGTLRPYLSVAPLIRLVLATPQVGAFAEAYLPRVGPAVFSALSECVLEFEKDHILLTKKHPSAMPPTRFQTGIRTKSVSKSSQFLLAD